MGYALSVERFVVVIIEQRKPLGKHPQQYAAPLWRGCGCLFLVIQFLAAFVPIILVDGVALYEIILEPLGSPLAELGAALRFYSITVLNNYIEVVKLDFPLYLPIPFDTNCQRISLSVQAYCAGFTPYSLSISCGNSCLCISSAMKFIPPKGLMLLLAFITLTMQQFRMET
jgi:hypothetical protein